MREHGADTLSFFKLRTDKHYLFNPERTAFVAYRVENGVLMISGDPVGEPSGVETLLPVVVAFAGEHGLRLAALGVSAEGRALFEQAGLRALYMGDEAIVDGDRFSLDGRPIRKVRQSVTRLRKAGYRTEIAELGSLGPDVVARLEEVAHDWLRGAPERGFSMAMDSLRNPAGEDTLVVYAVDEGGTIRGFLHFVPTYGRAAVSLSYMRRQRETPNGLTEFLVAEGIEHLRARGIAEVSLNFAAFARFIRQPSGVAERALGRALAVGDTWFQIERLYRFNAKFFPRWEPRYFMYERRLGLPRAGIAALWLEGQLPKPTTPPPPRGRERLSRPLPASPERFPHGGDRLLAVPREPDEEDRERDLDEHGLEHGLDLTVVAAGEHDVEPRVAEEQRRRDRRSRGRPGGAAGDGQARRRRAPRRAPGRTPPRRCPSGGSCAAPAAGRRARASRE